MGKTIYRGEGLVKRWGDSSSALRTVTLQLQEDEPLSRHPFFGFDGRRVAVVIVELDETEPAGGTDLTRSGSGQSRERLAETPPANQNIKNAMALINDRQFWAYLGTQAGVRAPNDATEAEMGLKFLCNIQSKKELIDRTKAAETFERLRQDFYAWRRAA